MPNYDTGIDVDRIAEMAERLDLVGPDLQGPEEDPEMMAAPWYAHDGRLWIIGPDEIEGPDDGFADALALACRQGRDLDEAANEIGLTKVCDNLKRWGPEDGYYNA